MIINILGAIAFPVMFLFACYFGLKHLNKNQVSKKRAELRRKCKVEKTTGDSIGKEWHKNKPVIDEAEEFERFINDQEMLELIGEEL